MKKILLTAVVVGAVGFVAIQMASARPWGYGPGPGRGCGNYDNYATETPAPGADSSEFESRRQKFLDETSAVRRQLEVKEAEYTALMRQENPDEKRAATLAGELYDLRAQLQAQAAAAGLGRFGGGFGNGGPSVAPCYTDGAGWDERPCWQNR